LRHWFWLVPIVILVVGVTLWWPPEGEFTEAGVQTDRSSDLGAALISGAVVAFAVLFIERRQTPESEKRNMQVALSTTQELDGADLSGYELTRTSFLRHLQVRRA
jgi:hypothetical protein